MNEEKKHKKLNIKKIAVVALSVMMIMTTFCLSAFADNPLTSKSKYITSANNLPNTIYTSVDSSDAISYNIADEEGSVIDIYFNNNQNASTVELQLNSDDSIILMIGDQQVLAYSYNTDTTNYDLQFNQTLYLDINEEQVYSAEAQIAAINAAIDSVLYDQNPQIVETFSKYTAKEVTTTGILSTFLGIGTWIGGAVSALIGMFYINGSLTFIGYLAVAALAVSVVFLLIYLISSFLKFRG